MNRTFNSFQEAFPLIDAFVDNILGKDSSGHDAQHCRRVAATAIAIAENEVKENGKRIDLEIVYAAAMLHDVWDHKICADVPMMRVHTLKMLIESGIEARDADVIFKVVDNISWSKGGRPLSAEAACVQDADRLDAIGAIGIARVFAYGGSKGRGLDSSVQHFHDKLLKIKDSMNTALGRSIAHERHERMESFLADMGIEGFGVECPQVAVG